MASTSKDPILMDSCAFCTAESRDLYKCPKCDRFYCSLKCYKNEKHWICSEKFYKQQVEEHVNESDSKVSGAKFDKLMIS